MPNLTIVITTGDATLTASGPNITLWAIGGAELALCLAVALIVGLVAYFIVTPLLDTALSKAGNFLQWARYAITDPRYLRSSFRAVMRTK